MSDKFTTLVVISWTMNGIIVIKKIILLRDKSFFNINPFTAKFSQKQISTI